MAAPQETGTPTPPVNTDTPKPGAANSISDRMRAKGWTPEEVGEGSHGEERVATEPEAPTKPGVPAKKKAAQKPAELKPDAPEPTEEPEPAAKPAEEPKGELGGRGLLEKLAKEQGFEVVDGKVLTKERAEFRILKEEQRKQLQQAEKQAIERIETAKKELDERYGKVDALETAIKNRDHVALAKALGHDDWDKLQQTIVAWNSDPAYQERLEMREKIRAIEEKEQQAAEQRQQQERAQQEFQARQQHFQQLSTIAKESTDPLVAAMHDDPLFLQAVFRIQQEKWDGREAVLPEHAVNMSAGGARVTLREELKNLYSKLHRAFGKPEAEKPAAVPVAKTPPKPKTPGPSLPAKGVGRLDRMRNYSARLSEASERDRKQGNSF